MTKPPPPRQPRPPQPRPQTRNRPGAKPQPARPEGDAPKAGERIAKVLARAGVASRREAEGMIAEGRVSVNGLRIDSPALNVTPRDRISVDGKPLAAAEPARVWLYHKPLGLVTTARDEKGRATVFDELPEDLPRVMSVGRLDINSEGLLLLTNDGDLKRRLELPATGWLRKYRARVKGTPSEAMLEPLRKGIDIDGERFQPMIVAIDRQQGANAWLTIGIREGKNREIRRAMEAVGLVVNRLIRVSYGPFQLGDLAAGAVQELRPRVLRDQLGIELPPEPENERPRRGAAAFRHGGAKGSPSERPASGAPRAGATDRTHGNAAKPAPGGRSGSGKPVGSGPRRKEAPGTDFDHDPTAKAKPRSWSSRSHGGPARGKTDTPADERTAKPRSWGAKRATPSTEPPRKPTGPRRPR